MDLCVYFRNFFEITCKREFARVGVILDPEKVRGNLEPFSRSKDGQYSDIYDEFRE
ncbi:MAG: hypothetical protein Q4B36_02185 [Tissierellia bacterium]|nr:hypothetical protein [Tissierellia bacterium]